MIRGLTIRVGRTGADFFGGSGLFLKRASYRSFVIRLFLDERITTGTSCFLFLGLGGTEGEGVNIVCCGWAMRWVSDRFFIAETAGIGFAVCRFGGFVGWLVEATET